ncbi:MAG: N-acetylmuramoyl-L-alanine amidase [candidate division WOR-3 bacterium]
MFLNILFAVTWTICIDPGHGGSDPGATGLYYMEKQANLDVAFWAKHYFERAGLPGDTVIVGMTRTTDVYVSLADRVYYANSQGFDRFVSIHHNAYNTQVQGTETYCYTYGSANSFAMRDSTHPWLLWAFGYPNRGAQTADFYVLRETVMPAILGEASFIDYRDGYDESYRFYAHWNRHDEREGFAYARGVSGHLRITPPVFQQAYSISGTVSLSPPQTQTIHLYCYKNYSDSLVAYKALQGPGPFRLDSLIQDTYDLYFSSQGYNSAFITNIALSADTSGLSATLYRAWPEIIIDNLDPWCFTQGNWRVSEWSPRYYGLNYIWSDGTGIKRLLFMPDLPQTGQYEVSVWFTEGWNRAQNAPYVVHHAGGVDTFYVDQTTGGGQWISLGTFGFNEGQAGYVELGNWGLAPDSTRVVIGDGVRFSVITGATETSGASLRPFFDQTSLALILPSVHSGVEVSVYDPAGRMVQTHQMKPGETLWKIRGLSRGVYFLRLIWEGEPLIFKFIGR